jgi:hypothetical protein
MGFENLGMLELSSATKYASTRPAPATMLSGAVLVIAQRSITDLVTALLALATVALLWCFKKIPEPASCWWPRCWD